MELVILGKVVLEDCVEFINFIRLGAFSCYFGGRYLGSTGGWGSVA